MVKYNGIEIDYSRDSKLSEFGLTVFKSRAMRGKEVSPQEVFARTAVAYCAGDLALAQRIYDYASNLWIGFATPVLTNSTYPDEPIKALPISCYLSYNSDTVKGLLEHHDEIAWLTVLGGGTGGHWSDVRAAGNKSPGAIPFIKSMDTLIETWKQGEIRRGAYAAYLDISHPDVLEFLKIRIPTGDASRKCNSLGFHNAINITDAFMSEVINDGKWSFIDPHSKEIRDTVRARDVWEEILTTRVRTGEPYLLFIDTANKYLPATQRKKGLRINGSNLCIEIMLSTNNERTAVCCLSSLNADKYDEWKNSTVVEDMITFLDNVLQVFIDNAPDSISRAKYSAIQERALGLGLMGWHSLLKKHRIPFGDVEAYRLNIEMWKNIKERADKQSKELGATRGEAPDMVGTGYRNSHKLALAPTATNASSLGVSPSCEPVPSNIYTRKAVIGSVLVKDVYLERDLEEIGMNTEEVWHSISVNDGSVQHLDVPDWIKEVHKTSTEIDQMDIIKQAADRTPYICQGQSTNIAVKEGTSKADYNKLHLAAWELGLKSLYYSRLVTSKVKAASTTERANVEVPKQEEVACAACEG